ESGGPAGLYAAALDADSLASFESRIVLVQRVVQDDQAVARSSSAVSQQAKAMASAAQVRAAHAIGTERTVAQAAAKVMGLLAQEQALLDTANARVRQLKSAEAAAAALRAQAAAFTVITSDRIASMRMLPASPAYMALYHQAAVTCAGLSWTVLAAIGQVES